MVYIFQGCCHYERRDTIRVEPRGDLIEITLDVTGEPEEGVWNGVALTRDQASKLLEALRAELESDNGGEG